MCPAEQMRLTKSHVYKQCQGQRRITVFFPKMAEVQAFFAD